MRDLSQDDAAGERQLGPNELALLQQANQLMANGQAGQAAPMLAQLADQMEASNHPRRAANLHARAAHAFADSQAGPMALGQARSAMALFLANGMGMRAPMFFSNITRKLSNHGLQNAASALQQEFGGRLHDRPRMRRRMGGQMGTAAGAAAAPTHGTLPTTCPKCGAPVHGSEANWLDNNTAECDYCGALLRAE